MPLELIQEQVNIYKCPSVDKTHQVPGAEFTIGDLHGNAMKFIFMLIKQGIVSNISESDYKRLLAIYTKPNGDLTKDNLQEFQAIIDQMVVNTDCFVRLIGDELGDRGKNDYFTLLLLRKLHQENLPMEIVLSNHGAEFINRFANTQKFQPDIQEHQISSLMNIIELIKKGLIDEEEVIGITREAYKPYLKAITYSLSEDKKEISIYSHAPINIVLIKYLAGGFNVPFADETAEQLAKTIDAINVEFNKHVDADTVSQQIQHNRPLYYSIWNRDEEIDRARNYKGYSVNYVHGHTGNEGYYQSKKNIVNLNNILGILFEDEYHIGTYSLSFRNPIKELIDQISNQDLKSKIIQEYNKLIQGSINQDTFKKNVAIHFNHELTNNTINISEYNELFLLLFVEPIYRKSLLDIKKSSGDESVYNQILMQYISNYQESPINKEKLKTGISKIIQEARSSYSENQTLIEQSTKLFFEMIILPELQTQIKSINSVNSNQSRNKVQFLEMATRLKEQYPENQTLIEQSDKLFFEMIILPELQTEIKSINSQNSKQSHKKVRFLEMATRLKEQYPDSPTLKNHLDQLIFINIIEKDHQQKIKEIQSLNSEIYKEIINLYIQKFSESPIDDKTFKTRLISIAKDAKQQNPDNKILLGYLDELIFINIIEKDHQQKIKEIKSLNSEIYKEIINLYIQKFSESPIDDKNFNANLLEIAKKAQTENLANEALLQNLDNLVVLLHMDDVQKEGLKRICGENDSLIRSFKTLLIFELKQGNSELIDCLNITSLPTQTNIRNKMLSFISQEHVELKSILSDILNKTEKFDGYYEKYGDAAKELFDTIIEKYVLAQQGRVPNFIGECNTAIKKALVTLEKNRDYFPQLINLIAQITILPALLNKLFTGQWNILQTDSSKKVQNLKERLQCLQFQNTDNSDKIESKVPRQ